MLQLSRTALRIASLASRPISSTSRPAASIPSLSIRPQSSVLLVPSLRRRFASHDIDGNQTNASEETSDLTSTTERVKSAVSSAASGLASATGLSQGFQKKAPLDVTPKESIFIGNLAFAVTENDLKQVMEKFGQVIKAKIVYDQRGLSKGIGFVDFLDLESAKNAIAEMHGQQLEGRPLVVQYATRKGSGSFTPPQNPPTTTLFIGNMSFEMTDEDINALFRGIEDTQDIRVAIDRRTGQPRGFAHAEFGSVESAKKAAEQLKGKQILGRTLRIDFSTDMRRNGVRSNESPASEQEQDAGANATDGEKDDVSRA